MPQTSLRSQSIPGYPLRIPGTLIQDRQQPAGGGVAQSDCCPWGTCLGSHETLQSHTGKTEKLLMFITLLLCHQCLTESRSWVTLAVIQGCAGTGMPRSAKHLLPLLPPLQVRTPEEEHNCVLHTHALSLPLPPPISHRTICWVFVSTLHEMRSPWQGQVLPFLSVPRHTRPQGCVIPNRKYNLCLEVIGKVTLLLRDLQSKQNEIFFLCFWRALQLSGFWGDANSLEPSVNCTPLLSSTG